MSERLPFEVIEDVRQAEEALDQLAFGFDADGDQFGRRFQALMTTLDETPDPALTVRRRWAVASAPPPCPVTIWDVAARAAAPAPQDDLFGGTEHAPVSLLAEPPQVPTRGRKTVNTVKRMKGRTVVSGLAYPDNRWTDERAERERVRRLLQPRPKPSAAARVCRFGSAA